MFYAIDKNTNNLVFINDVSYNQLLKTKQTVNFNCMYCRDNKCIVVYSKIKRCHFRNSKEVVDFSLKTSFHNYNNEFNYEWFKLLIRNKNLGYLINDDDYKLIRDGCKRPNFIKKPYTSRKYY